MAHRLDEAERSDLLSLGHEFSSAELSPLHLAYQRRGWKAYQAKKIVLIAKQPRNGCALFEMGEGYLQLGDLDRAFPWLARGVEAGCYWADSLLVDPLLDGIRSDARYPALLQLNHLEAPRR